MKISLLLSILFFSSTVMNGQNSNIDKSIDAIVLKNMEAYSIVGLSIGIVKDGDFTFKGYGAIDHSSEIEVDEHSMFHVASISKLFTASAIMKLVEEKKLHLEDKLIDVLPTFKMKDVRHKEITIRHLLTHSSGLKWDNKLNQSPDDKTSLDKCISNLRNEKLNFTPGEKTSYKTYSNAAFDLLGIVVREISGLEFDEFVRINILEKVGMESSTYFFEEVDSNRLALPQIVSGESRKIKRLNAYGIDDDKKPIMNGKPVELRTFEIYGEDYEHNPSGNLISSAKDMAYWMKYNLDLFNGNETDGIINKSTQEKMWSPQMKIADSKTSIGLGWWINEKDTYGKSVFHVGNYTGFCSIQLLYPEKEFGITILCNGWYAQKAVWGDIFNEIEKLFLE